MVIGKTMHVGWSLCHVKSGDHYKKEVGDAMALGRLVKAQVGQHVALTPGDFINPTKAQTVSKTLMAAGVAQSTTSAIRNLVSDVLNKRMYESVDTVYVYTEAPK